MTLFTRNFSFSAKTFFKRLETCPSCCNMELFSRFGKSSLSPHHYMNQCQLLSTNSNFFQSSQRLLLNAPEIQEAQDFIRQTSDNLITVPVHLKRRLDKKMVKEDTRGHRRMKIVEKSRAGKQSQAVIHCKRNEFNYYLGQSYAKNREINLASKSWHHPKAAGDWFIIKPALKASAFGFPELGEVTFEDLGVKPDIITRLKENQAIKPTFIQQLAIKKILDGSNNMLTAETGCGKTLAYLIPMVQQILAEKRRRLKRDIRQPLGVILVPSHELAAQIHYVASKLTEGMGINVKLLEGGNIGSKITSPHSGEVDLLISTVHVLSALKSVGIYTMNKVQHIVLDEADTLLDDSFSPGVVDFLNGFSFDPSAPRMVQLTLVSATLPKTVESTLEDVIPLESLSRISTPGIHYVMPHVPQTFLRLKKSEKPGKLLEILQEDVEKGIPVMIFCNRTKTCDWMRHFLKDNGISFVSVHGEQKPSDRKGLLNKYQNGDVDVIVCTDLGSRGINTIRTRHVINYEFPMFTADYIHRCGRTGRVGSTGSCKVTNFVTRRFEFEVVKEIEKSVRKEVSISKVDANIKRLIAAKYGMFQSIVGDDTNEIKLEEKTK